MYARCMFALALAVATTADAQTYTLTLAGSAENPPNASPGTGSGTLVYNAAARTLAINLQFSGLMAPTTAAHIHCCADPPANIGVATQTPSFSAFPLGVTSGNHVQTLDLTQASSFNATFINNNGGTPASAEAALAAGMAAGRAYYNIHSTTFPGGEIRGFTVAVSVFANGFEATSSRSGGVSAKRASALAGAEPASALPPDPLSGNCHD